MAITVTCNMCGKKLNYWDLKEKFSIHTRMGYGTNYDGEHLELDLCSKCMDTLIKKCVITPIIKDDLMVGGD